MYKHTENTVFFRNQAGWWTCIQTVSAICMNNFIKTFKVLLNKQVSCVAKRDSILL